MSFLSLVFLFYTSLTLTHRYSPNQPITQNPHATHLSLSLSLKNIKKCVNVTPCEVSELTVYEKDKRRRWRPQIIDSSSRKRRARARKGKYRREARPAQFTPTGTTYIYISYTYTTTMNPEQLKLISDSKLHCTRTLPALFYIIASLSSF